MGGTQPIIGNVPGIVVYGSSEGRSGVFYQREITDRVYPLWEQLPGQRRWSDGWSAIGNNEFTTWETMVWNVCMHSVLYNASEDNTANIIISTAQTPQPMLSIHPNPLVGKGVIQIKLNQTQVSNAMQINVINMEGQLVQQIPIHTEESQTLNYSLQVDASLPLGIYVVQLHSSQGLLAQTKFIHIQP